MTILPDLLQPGLALVFCGTAPGTVSAQRKAYYANPGNAFWPTLHAVGLTPHRVASGNYASVLQYGIGLTDLAKNTFGADSSLAKTDFDRVALEEKIMRFQPGLLAFTSKRAGLEFLGHPVGYGLQAETIGTTRLFVLPSPSGLARSHWTIEPWEELARLRQALQC
ncbi:MAG TPA: mismatch-specific DNA-glycosylase [Limnobacter sp.]|nr:mismatch-specific DNA-glycosylase [Limnobacter sp.]